MIELTVNFVLKFFHILGLMLGAASGFGAMLVARQARRAAAPSPELAALRPQFVKLGLAGILLLWLSGLGLWIMRYDMVDLGAAYTAKLIVAFVLLVIVVLLTVVVSRALAAGKTPPAWAPKLGMTTPVLMLVAMALGVWVFI